MINIGLIEVHCK